MSDIEDFERREPPRGRRSKLEDHAEEILRLHDKWYTHRQIQTFLADAKGVRITEKSICVWIKKRLAKQTVETIKEGTSRATPDVITTPLVTRADRPRPVVSTVQSSADDKAREIDEAFRLINQEQIEPPKESLLEQVMKVKGQSS